MGNRKSLNLAKAKLGLYEKWYRRMSRSGSKIESPAGVPNARAVREHRKARYRARRYYEQLLASYQRISLPLNDESIVLATHLDRLDPFSKTVYVMKTGFGKGISFSESQIARILRSSKAAVNESFVSTSLTLDSVLRSWVAEPGELFIDLAELTPALIRYLQSHEESLDKLSWQLYEQLVAEFFASWGYEVSLVGRDSSTSADIIAVRPPDQSGVTLRYFIEVKKWKGKVGIETINQVVGAIFSERVLHGFHVGVIIASNGYRDLKKFSIPSLSYMGVELRDGQDVRNWLRSYTPSKTGLWIRN